MTKLNVDLIYPIGSIYMSVNSTNPNIYFGGTWEAWGTGRVPVGIDTSQTEFNTVEKIGGSKYLQQHLHDGITWYNTPISADGGTGAHYLGVSVNRGSGNTASNYHTGGVNSSTQTGNSGNLQPYITCYMWKRTA